MTEADATKWKQTYVYGLPHERLSMTFLPANDHDNGWEPSPGVGGAEPGTPPKTLWYLTGALGSTLSLLEKDGRKSVSYHYDEFGIPLDDKKFDVNWPGPDNLFGYTGLGYEYYSELSYARARYYQPEIGRFISEDPYKGDLWNPQSQNRFVYVHNNPIIYIDPSGYWAVSIPANWTINGTKLEWEKANKAKDKKKMQYWSDEANKYRKQLKDAGYSDKEIMQSHDRSIPKEIVLELAWESTYNWIENDPYGIGVIVYAYENAPVTRGAKVGVTSVRYIANGKIKVRMTSKQATEAAKKLGYEKTNYTSHGQPVFKKGNKYITPDVDQHSGGVWKMADSVKNLGKKDTRMGTYDANLKRIGD